MIDGVIFDHDGTLIDTERLHYECWREILSELAIDFTLEEYIRDHNGVPTLHNAQLLVETYGIDRSAQQLSRKKQELTWARFAAQPCPLMPFAVETIQRCSDAGYSLAIATGAGQREIAQTMAAHGLRHHFAAIVTRDDVRQSKPAPDVYLLAQSRLGLRPEQCVAVEDTQAGIRSAKAAGLACIAVVNDFSRHQDLTAADARCENLDEAFGLIQRFSRAGTMRDQGGGDG